MWRWNQDVRRSDLGRYNLGALKPDTDIKAKRLISFQKSNGSWDKIFANRLKKTDE